MKKIIILISLTAIFNFAYGQKQFSSSTEALAWLKTTFDKYFMKTGYDTENSPKLDYEFTDTYLVISSRYTGYRKGNSFTLIPYKQISKVVDMEEFYAKYSNEAVGYKKSSQIALKSDCRCFKIKNGGKEFKGEQNFDELTNFIHLPFNIHEEKDILISLTNAFSIIGNNK